MENEALAQPSQEPVAYDKTEMNGFVQDLYDKKMQESKHGHYETMFHVVHQAIKRATPPQPEQEPWRESASDYERGFIDGRQKQAQSSVDKAVNRMAQRTWVEPTEGEWFEWWRVSAIADSTEAEIDFADFLTIAQAVVAKLKEDNNG